MKKILMVALCLVIVPMLFAAESDADVMNKTVGPTNAAPIQLQKSASPRRVPQSRDLLFSQIPSTTANAVSCQLDSVYPFESDLVEDVTPTEDWMIDSVVGYVGYWGSWVGWSLVPNVRFLVYADSSIGNHPVDSPFVEIIIDQGTYETAPYGAYYTVGLPLPYSVNLTAGVTYWLEVQPCFSFAANGQSGTMAEVGIGNGQEFFSRFPLLGTLVFTTATAGGWAGQEAGIELYGTTGAAVLTWDFETGWQDWTNTNGQVFPAAWGVMESDYKATWQLPESGDSSMWIDSDASGGGYADTALSPVLVPKPTMDWLKYGVSYNWISTGEWLEVGIKYYDGATWNVVPLAIYTADTGPMWDSVDVSAYVSYPFVQVYFFYDDNGIWAWYAAFDNVSIDAFEAEHDVGTDAILEPVGTYFLNDVVTPRAQVKNFGAFDETFPVIFTMTHNAILVYADTVDMTLVSGAVDTAVFAQYTLDQTGTYDIVGYTELVGDEDPANDTATAQANVYEGLIPYIVIDVDPTPLTGPWLDAMFQSWGLTGVFTTNPAFIDADSLSIYQTAWICCGIYSNWYDLTNAQATAIGDYLATGRNAYFEGGDSWGFGSSRTILCPLFGIDPNATFDGSADLFQVDGMANGQIPEVDGHNWAYTGENNYIDQLGLYASPPNGGTVEGFLWNSSVQYWTGAAYDQGTWKTVGLSHELAGDVAGTIPGDSLLWWIAEYLDLIVGITEEPGEANIAVFGFAPNMSTVTKQPIINYSTTTQGRECLKVYDNTGRLIRTLVDRPNEAAGTKSVYWNRKDDTGRTVANGVYFIRLESVNQYATHKLILVK